MTLEDIRKNMINLQDQGAFIGLDENLVDFETIHEEFLGDYESWLEDEFFMGYLKCDLLEVMDIELEDDITQHGGISFEGETVRHFVEEINEDEPIVHDLETLNVALEECGILPINKLT